MSPKSRRIQEPPEVAELREAFFIWAKEHGLVWFNNDVRLAEAVATILNINLVWPEDGTEDQG